MSEIENENELRRRLLEHQGHDVTVVAYGDPDNPADVCLECEDCGCVVLDSELYDLRAVDETEYFGVVRWCDEDLKDAFETRGIEPTKEMVSVLRSRCEKPLTDLMIERGWEVIDSVIPSVVDDYCGDTSEGRI